MCKDEVDAIVGMRACSHAGNTSTLNVICRLDDEWSDAAVGESTSTLSLSPSPPSQYPHLPSTLFFMVLWSLLCFFPSSSSSCLVSMEESVVIVIDPSFSEIFLTSDGVCCRPHFVCLSSVFLYVKRIPFSYLSTATFSHSHIEQQLRRRRRESWRRRQREWLYLGWSSLHSMHSSLPLCVITVGAVGHRHRALCRHSSSQLPTVVSMSFDSEHPCQELHCRYSTAVTKRARKLRNRKRHFLHLSSRRHLTSIHSNSVQTMNRSARKEGRYLQRRNGKHVKRSMS